MKTKLYVALIHYPVIDKHGETIASAVTNLDIHDISRAAKTYGAERFYVVTPLSDQRDLVEKIMAHWTVGFGAGYNPSRRKALELIRVRDSLGEVVDEIRKRDGASPRLMATCARQLEDDRVIGFGQCRKQLEEAGSILLLFGTAWGLAKEVLSQADHILEPVRGNTDYNHLSVRCAAAVILDRLVGQRTEVGGQRSEVRDQRSETGNSELATPGPKLEI